MPPLLVAGHLCQLPHTPAPAAKLIDVDAEKKAVILPAPVYNPLTGDVYELPAETIKAVDGFPACRPVFGRKGRVKPRLCTRLACTSKRSTRRRGPAGDSKGTLPFEQHIKTKIKYEKNIENTITNYNSLQLHTSAGIPGQYPNTGFALYMYRQFMSSYIPKGKCASVPCRRHIPPILPVYVFKCVPVPVPVPVPVQTFVPVPDASVSSVHQYRYRKLWEVRYFMYTGTGNFGKFGTTSIPVPEYSVSSVHQYRYRKLR